MYFQNRYLRNYKILKYKLNQNKKVRDIYFLLKGTKDFFKFKPLLLIKKYYWFFKQFVIFKKNQQNKQFQKIEWQPCLFDNVLYTPIEPTYFFQDSWAAKQIFKLEPNHHYDIGSSVKTISILSQFVPITMVDIRPIELELENLIFKKGSILELPFEDNSIETLSSLCVVEHVGLGRYGDIIDPYGSEKAIK